MRNRLVRATNATTTTYEVQGFFLNEKAKATFRSHGLKTKEMTWAEVFPNLDVVYRFNEKKGKSDVFIGQVTRVKYASGKIRQIAAPRIDIHWDMTDLKYASQGTLAEETSYFINSNEVRRSASVV